MGKDAESWLVLLRQAAVLILASVARFPKYAACHFSPRHPNPFRSQYAVAHLNVLNNLLQQRSEGAHITNSIFDYLLQRNFYPLLAQAIASVVSVPP